MIIFQYNKWLVSILFFIVTLSLINYSQAENYDDVKSAPYHQNNQQTIRDISYLRNTWYGNVFAGTGAAFIGKHQVLTMTSSVVNGYDGNNSKEQQAYMLGLGGGYSFMLAPAWDLDVGLEATYINYNRSHGVVHPMVNISPNVDTLNYSYDAKSYALMGATDLRWWVDQHSFVSGYAAAGIAWNRLSSYSETVPPGSSMSPTTKPFLDRTTRQPAFSVGVAVGYQVHAHWAIEMGYRYINTRNANLKAPAGSISQPNFTSGILSAHMIYVNLFFG